MPKPFIAARVPQILVDKLEEHVKESGQGKTDIIVNALAQYLGCSIDVPEETRAVDRLVAVEKELTELKIRVGVLEKPTEKTPPPQIENQRVLSFETLSIDNTVDSQTENTEKTTEGIKEVSNTKPDNDLLTNRQISEVTGIKFETVRGRYKKSIPIEYQGKRYAPIKEGKFQKWQLANSSLSMPDN